MNLSNSLVSAVANLVQRHSSEFDNLWKNIEAKWREWTSADLTEWLKYQSLHFETGAIDWTKTSELLQFQKMDGKILPSLNAIVFPLIGITDKETIDHLVSSINSLLKRSEEQKRTKQSDPVPIPAEFLCPISKEIMKDPVLAFDGQNYERTLIENYLKQHNKSPVTGDVAEHSFVIPNKVLKKRIDAFLNGNNQFVQKEKDSSVKGLLDPETPFI